jgi:hypothetical protein
MASIEDQKKKFTLHKGPKVDHEALYAQLFQYFQQMHKSKLAVTTSVLCIKMKELKPFLVIS